MTDAMDEASKPRMSRSLRSLLIGAAVVALLASAVGVGLYMDSQSASNDTGSKSPITKVPEPTSQAAAPKASGPSTTHSPSVTAPSTLPTVDKAGSRNPFKSPIVAKTTSAGGPGATPTRTGSVPTRTPTPPSPGKDGKDGRDGKDGKDGKNASLQVLFLAYVANDADAPKDHACSHNPEVPGGPPVAPYPLFIVDTGDGTLPCYVGVPGRFLSAERGIPASWIKYSGLGSDGGVENNNKAVIFLGDETYTLNLGEAHKVF